MKIFKKILSINLAFFIVFSTFLITLASFNPPPAQTACTVLGPPSYSLTRVRVVGNTATLRISPALGAAAAVEYQSITSGELTQSLPAGTTNFDINVSDGFWTARINYLGACITSNVTFNTPGTSSVPGGSGTDCTSFDECSDVPAPIDDGGEFPGRESGFIGTVINAILPVAIGLGAFLSVIMIVISGIQFISSNGNPEGAAAARGRLTFALVGLALLALAYGITVVIDSVFLNNSGVF